MREIKPKDVKPKKNGQSDFFSWQLYKWLCAYSERTRIYKALDGTVYIGDAIKDGWVYGRRLRELCSYKAGLQGYAFSASAGVNQWTDITEEFWTEYLKIGTCAIHGDLWHEWVETSTTRQCQYCGKVEHKKERIVTETYWEAA